MKQPGFMIYAEDWACYTEDYSDEELGRMLRALLGYFDAQEQPTFDDRGMRQFFKLASKSIDLDRMRYEKKCRLNAYIRYKGLCRQERKKPLSFEEWEAAVESRRQNAPDDTGAHQSLPVVTGGLIDDTQTSPDVTKRHQTSPDVTERHQTSPDVTGGHQTSPDVTERHQTSPTITPTFNDQPPTVNRQQPTVSNQKQEIKNKKSVFSPSASGEPRFEDRPYRPLTEDAFEKQREQMIASLRTTDRHFL